MAICATDIPMAIQSFGGCLPGYFFSVSLLLGADAPLPDGPSSGPQIAELQENPREITRALMNLLYLSLF